MGLLLAPVFFISCRKEPEDAQEGALPEILVLFDPGGLGDRAYNDQILRGVELAINDIKKDFYISFITPEDLEDVAFLIESWWEDRDLTDENGLVPRRLLVLASSDYAEIAREIVDTDQLSMDCSILAFEVKDENVKDDNIYTFGFSMYGVSWLAGSSARDMGCEFSLVLMGSGGDTSIYDAVDGFIDGFGKGVAVDAMADDYTGYNMSTELYHKMYEYDGRFDFIYSISGGSNMGIYRYLRENPDCGIYTAGMDIDQSPYSTLIIGSMVKRIDLVVFDSINTWIDCVEVPQHRSFGLESGYIDWIIPDRYSDLRPKAEAVRQEAIQKEKEYEASH